MQIPVMDVRALFAAIIAPSLLGLAGCGQGPSGPAGGAGVPTEPPATGCEVEYDGTFAAIQDVIFERHGCTQSVCHGAAASGGLDLSPDVAYDNIVGARARGSAFRYVEIGDDDSSYLFLKLAAATDPGGMRAPISGQPMPSGLPPLSDRELQLLRRWILLGAPREGTVAGTAELVDACLPEVKPLAIDPLPQPEAGTGVQFRMPPWTIEANSEFEGCMAAYYDFADEVPDEFKDPSGEFFRFKGFELRQDAQTHHWLLYYSPLNLEPGGIDVDHPSFGSWTCRGGDREGQLCAPKDLQGCGEGICTSELKPSFACAGYGPPSPLPAQIVGGAGQAQASFPFAPGVFQEFPIRGVMYFNSHSFNPTRFDHVMNGRVNYNFATSQIHRAERISDFSAIFRPDNAPFTKETFCNDHVFPVGSRVFHLFAHTHRHGERYWITLHDGTQIYESFDYTDPVQRRYEPPLKFDSPNRAERTITYCATFNNGVRPDGSPDPETVTRQSRIPPSARQLIGDCSPTACVNEGMVDAPCGGVDDDAACDTAPGAGDGDCDACKVTGGESTENSMFVLFGAQYIDESVPGAEPSLLTGR